MINRKKVRGEGDSRELEERLEEQENPKKKREEDPGRDFKRRLLEENCSLKMLSTN